MDNEPREMEIEEEPKPKPKPKRRRLVAVRVMAAEGESALVEWQGKAGRFRAYVPAVEVQGDKCATEILEAGIPYGVSWERCIADLADLTPKRVAAELRRAGIWTLDDLRVRRKQAKLALAGLAGLAVGEIERAAREFEEG